MNQMNNSNYSGMEESKENEQKQSANEESHTGVGFVQANTYQAAILNKLLPRGFKIDLEEIVQRNLQQRQAANCVKKAA